MFLLSSCASLCLLAGTDLPLAQVSTSEASDLGEIVVLGNRKQRDLTLGAGAETERMSPSSRSIESDLLNAIGAVRMADALELVSGVSQQNNRGGVMDNFAIRGFLGTPDGGAEYYVDGFLANRGMAPPRDPSTAERIEVLKGPAGALFGDIDPAGRVNIVSKTPRFTPDAQFTATLGSFGLRRGELDLTGPVSENTAGRIVLTGETSSGWRDHVGLDRTVIAPSLTWQPLHGLRLTYVGEFTTFSTLFDRGQPAINGDALALPASHYFGEPSDGLTHFRNERHQVTGEYQLNDSWILSGGFAWRGGTLKGLSSDHSRLVGDTLWRQRRGRDFSVEDISARLELRGELRTAVGVHHVAFGTKAYKLAYGERWLRINPTEQHPYPINVFEPVYGGSAPTPLPFTDNLEEREVVTFYMQDMWEVTERLSLSAGLRYDHYEQMILNNRTGQTGSNDDTPVDYRLAGRYRLNDNFTLHASYGQSFVLNSGTGRNGSGFAPEEGKGYELGLAGAWDNLDVNITYFDIEKTNILTNDPVDANYLAPVGRLTTRGIELDGAFRLDNRWQVVANYAWTEARADDASFASDDVLNVPEHSGSAFIIGRFSTAHNTQWSFTAGAAYSGDRAAAIDGSGVRLPAYWKSKAAIEYGLTSRIAARVEVDNLFDERYAQSSYSSLWVFPGRPRSFTASLKLSL